MKTFPVLLLTFSLYAPTSLAAPASHLDFAQLTTRDAESGVNPVNFAADTDASETTTARPAATAFFTPAVFLDNYYDRTSPSMPEPTEVVNEEVAFLDSPATETPFDVATAYDAAQTSVDGSLDATSTLSASAVEPTQDVKDTLDTTASFPDDDAAATSVPESGSVPTPTSTLLNPTSISTVRSATSTWKSVVPEPTQSHASSAESRQTIQSRKAAIVGTLLALGSIIALMLCGFCMRCHLPRALRRIQASKPEDATQPNDKDPEKASQSPGKSSNTILNVVTLPVLKSNASCPFNDVASGSEGQQQDGQNKPEYRFLSARGDGQFEDVTHILSEDTFAPHDSDVGSNRSSTSSNEQDSTSGGRKSHANSVAQSYATCESRYSMPSIQEGDQSISEQTASFHSAKSPPDSPEPETPKQQCTTRPRSKTLTQTQAHPANDKISSSKSFPARYSNVSSAHPSWISAFTEESEWDIAAAYGARYSKGSTGRPVSQFSPIAENMEAVDIGGRSCVLVQG